MLKYFGLVMLILVISAGTALGVATDCTLYASPSGVAGNSGRSPTSPKTFAAAASAGTAGAVICLMGGTYDLWSTFNPPNSGTANAWIVYKAYGDGPPRFLWRGRSGRGNQMFSINSSRTFPHSQHYLRFEGIILDGNLSATSGFFCYAGHHLVFSNNRVVNTGGAGIATVLCDYITSDHNLIFHNGYAPCCGWTSAISYNSSQFFDDYTGFHNLAINNIIAGEFDSSLKHSDGNGIILDLSCRSGCATLESAHTPPALIMNNIVYENGGRCIVANNVSDFYVINNTCYANGLDLTMSRTVSSYQTRNSRNGWFVNNISYNWEKSKTLTFEHSGANREIYYYRNMWSNGEINFSPPDPKEFLEGNPLFVNPPDVRPYPTSFQQAEALDPELLGNALHLQALSPAIHKGINPTEIDGLGVQLLHDLNELVYKDINGASRAAGTWDLGAYQYSAASASEPGAHRHSVH